MTWPQVAALAHDLPVVVPIAALEQHGRHMPLFTDSLLLGEVVRRCAEPLKARVLFTPLSASPRVYLDLLIDLAENLIAHGFRRIVLLNGHGGNIVPAQQALFELRQKLRGRGDLLLLSATYWTLGTRIGPIDAALKQTQMGHACEWETSMMLRLAPHLVGDYRNAPDVPWGRAFGPGHRAWITKERTEPGHIGYPQHASADKGELLFRAFAADVVAFLERVAAWDGQAWDI
jgi:creatinine amidohydrolase